MAIPTRTRLFFWATACILGAAASIACSPQTRTSQQKASPTMQIKFTRTGGFAGAATNVSGTVQFDEKGARVSGDSAYQRALSTQETEQLKSVSSPAAFAAAQAAMPSSGPVRDGYQYEVTVTTSDGKSHSLTLGDGAPEQAAMPAHLGSFIQEEAQKIWDHRVDSKK